MLTSTAQATQQKTTQGQQWHRTFTNTKTQRNWPKNSTVSESLI